MSAHDSAATMPRRSRGLPMAPRGLAAALVAAGAGGLALWFAVEASVEGPGAVPEVARGLGAAVLLYGVSGYALARVALPGALRPLWPLWVLPAGAVASALLMTLLGFAAVPYELNLALTLAAGALAAVLVHARGLVPGGDGGGPGRAGRLLLPAWIAALIVAIFLVPVFRHGAPTVIGNGSDSHLATGSATFLKAAYPTSTEPELPVDKMPLVWRSKYPVYYSLAAVSSLAGLDSVETIATLSALLAGIAALGFFLLLLHTLRARPPAALLGMALVGLNSMVFFTVTHPYFNQTWGLALMPFVMLLSWQALREPSRWTVALALMFAAVGAFAFPLMMAFPAALFAGFLVLERERLDWRRPLRRLPRGKRWWPLYALAGLLLAVPLYGVFEKVVTGAARAIPGRELTGWGGDIAHLIPVESFFSLPSDLPYPLLFVAPAAALAWLGLRGAPRTVRIAFAATAGLAGLFAFSFHERENGQYFYFKILAYLGPLVVALAAAGIARLKLPLALLAGAAWIALGSWALRDEIDVTFDHVTPQHRQLEAWSAELPPGSSIRLDVHPALQLWVAYFLHEHPLSSRTPIERTSYPHVPRGRKADFIVAETDKPRPGDARGRPLFENSDWTLYRMKPTVPGPDTSSQEMIQTIESIPLS